MLNVEVLSFNMQYCPGIILVADIPLIQIHIRMKNDQQLK
jgi:hypothetical protein